MAEPEMDIREDDLSEVATVALLDGHLEEMKRITPPQSVHALPVDALRAADVTLWSAWEGETLLGCGALRALSADTGEIKAMRTAEQHRRKGVGSALLRHIVEEARRRGYRRLYLETGASAAFAASRALYARNGFYPCGPFADYVEDPHSAFMVKHLWVEGESSPKRPGSACGHEHELPAGASPGTVNLVLVQPGPWRTDE